MMSQLNQHQKHHHGWTVQKKHVAPLRAQLSTDVADLMQQMQTLVGDCNKADDFYCTNRCNYMSSVDFIGALQLYGTLSYPDLKVLSSHQHWHKDCNAGCSEQ